MMLAFVSPADGLSVGMETTDITGRHYRLTPVLNTPNATGGVVNRRTLLKTCGIASLGIGGVASANSRSINISLASQDKLNTNEPHELWEYKERTEDRKLGEDIALETTQTVGYFGSTWVESRNSWYHDMRFSGLGGTAGLSGSFRIGEQSFELNGSDRVEWGEVTKDSHFGVWPTGDDTGREIDQKDAAIVVTAAAIGLFSPAVGFAISASTLVEQFLNTGAQAEDGLSMAYTPQKCSFGGSWCREVGKRDMGHHKRLFAVQDDCAPCRSSFTLETNMKADWNNKASVNTEFSVYPGENPGIGPQSGSGTIDPEEMSEEQLDEYNVVKIPTSSIEKMAGSQKTTSHSALDVVSSFARKDDTVYHAKLPMSATRNN
jgi:hypothetical protein